MGINIRAKGAGGEREICDVLNSIIQDTMRILKFPPKEVEAAGRTVQRNQNQSAVGGNDLTNTFGLSIEVKRQEQLTINTWWAQCLAAANRNNEHPVLLYRQNGKKWQCVTIGYLELPNGKFVKTRVAFDFDSFKDWFHAWVHEKLSIGEQVRT